MDIIFDVDGTLLNIEHEFPHLPANAGVKKDWTAFANSDQRPHSDVVTIACLLWRRP
jgi:FMN phosphatase YigB (HAD superfamily)